MASHAGPTTKERKYDRQLRLWAASGQQALESSRVLLINSDGPVDSDGSELTGVVGVETLKNLVLPGIGGFTIVDPATVSELDLGVNFLLSEDSLGKSRAEETCKYLRELNEDVDGWAYKMPILDALKDQSFLPQHQLVIVSGPIRQSTLRAISQASRRLDIPLMYTHSVGFYASFSLQLPSVFPIVETHPDASSTEDLRLTNPWPELAAAAGKAENLDGMDDHQHGHVPYLILLLHFLEQWKANHSGQYPQNYQEKSEFRDMVRSKARTNNPEGGEENFDEAVAAVLKSIGPYSLSSDLRNAFGMEECSQLTTSSSNFWIITASVKRFYETHSVLPLSGSLPDMKAQSSDYIWLQNIYKSKARQDAAEVLATVRNLECKLRAGLERVPISEKEVEIFCKNAAHIKVIKGRDIPLLPLDQSDENSQRIVKAIKSSLEIPDSLIPIFIALSTLDSLVAEFKETGCLNKAEGPSYLDETENWTAILSKHLAGLGLGENGMDESESDIKSQIESAVAEVRRAGIGELHNISAMAGGCIAQEALKVLTRQYVPLDNTFILDGVRSRGEMFRI
ncbi:NEDD8-activating enzyme E1 regulatory subunit [Nannizzia gypsea CBS 118893]|uniref:NEDD8-activating enzyme E1 regulatory subunit n=1 Tax=Arthroderma gypseum (strain ATCC MYA-4604 / CBS 118893) TaxID=535722 RepID=E5R2B3_ARTGP|nr:NEDD8-activating enzyme E1 regulatory subunit [Nannizzia gypsea CBS 118893]EFQ97003.1 NEDD8-activating enzyme E1 regulatory subunit [Nannizzia gypsea CBS 118893]